MKENLEIFQFNHPLSTPPPPTLVHQRKKNLTMLTVIHSQVSSKSFFHCAFLFSI